MQSPLRNPDCNICDILANPSDYEESLRLVEGDHWYATLRDDQSLLGTTFITLKTHKWELDQLTTEEEDEFIIIRNGLIRAIRTEFQPITFNLSCLKNDTFKHDPDGADPTTAHVHYHLKPRYDTRPRIVAGEEFTDPLPGKYLENYQRHKVDPETALRIAGCVFQALPAEVAAINYLQRSDPQV